VCKKASMAKAGKGKSGGVRIIYYFKKHDDEIWLLTIYSKSKIDNIPAHLLRQIAERSKMSNRDIGQEILEAFVMSKLIRQARKICAPIRSRNQHPHRLFVQG